MNQDTHIAPDNYTGLEIAVIGMSGRFPGAPDIHRFWQNLVNGIESISYYSYDELKQIGVGDDILEHPGYVPAYGWLEGFDLFDAEFFGYSPVEAELMDPQMRIFHQTVLESLEHAGYNPYAYTRPVGLYAGGSANFFWQARVELAGKNEIFGHFATKQLTDKDFLCTKIAHRLNLKGPAVQVDTACSTSLVAVHMACQGLIAGDCDMAVAGGVSIGVSVKGGYIYREGMLNSPDGHCRAFDAEAKGTNFGNASAAVVLKRFEDAVEDGDTIHAVIRGSAANNDGSRKAAYTAPSIDGQAQVIRQAQQMAEVEPETIAYVEAHGTGTGLGDPVEIEGLKTAFNSDKRHFCRIGSVKTNVGHLETASGIAGFIKAVLTVKHGKIPPSLFFRSPNPKIDFQNSPFVVNQMLSDWPEIEGPRRAGVSSFGIGGTNAHVVLEEHSAPASAAAPRRDYSLLLFSAGSEKALDRLTQNFTAHLKAHPGTGLADAAYTLQTGRKIHRYRRILAANGANEAIRQLSEGGVGVKTYCAEEDNRPVIFLFPGLGSQYVQMGRDLYEREPVFREEMDRCYAILKELDDSDTGLSGLKEVIYPADPVVESSAETLDRHEYSQAAVFIFEYSLARLLLSWGILPSVMLGYSFGEYVAACVAGVFSLEDGLKLVTARGRLVQQTPEGAMLSVPLPMKEVEPMLSGHPAMALAIDNGPSCVVSGLVSEIRELEVRLKQRRIMCMPVPANRALHSDYMESVKAGFQEVLAGMTLNEPEIPFISNVTGKLIAPGEAVSPGYWSRHLCGTVHFARGMKELLKDGGGIFIEVGPGRDIGTLAQRHIEESGAGGCRVLNIVRHPQQEFRDDYFLLHRLGMLWMYGQPIDWDGFYRSEKWSPRRVPLPAYPFEERRYWIDDEQVLKNSRANFQSSHPNASSFYIPVWKRFPLTGNSGRSEASVFMLFLKEDFQVGVLLAQHLEQAGHSVISVKTDSEFAQYDSLSFGIRPGSADDMTRLFKRMEENGTHPQRLVYMWDDCDSGYDVPRYVSLNLTQEVRFFAVTSGLWDVIGGESLASGRDGLVAAISMMPLGGPSLMRCLVDIGAGNGNENHIQAAARFLEREVTLGLPGLQFDLHTEVAWRNGYRWIRRYEPLPMEEGNGSNGTTSPSILRSGGVYLVIGNDSVSHPISSIISSLARKISKITRLIQVRLAIACPGGRLEPGLNEEIEKSGTQVNVYDADPANTEQLNRTVKAIGRDFGAINGVIHLSADNAKHGELQTLVELFAGDTLDFFWLLSRISLSLDSPGMAAALSDCVRLEAYTSRNTWYDRDEGPRRISVLWDRKEPHEIGEVFLRTIESPHLSHIVYMSGGDPHRLLQRWLEQEPRETASTSSDIRPRPELMTPFTAPDSPLERQLAGIWEELFGFGPLGIDDDFIELGGDSLKALNMISRVQEAIEVVMPLQDFFNRPTIEHMAQFMEGAGKEAVKHIPAVEKREYYPLSYIQERLFLLEKLGEREGTTAYNNVFGLLVEGGLDRERLENTLKQLTQRHESLRTSFHLVGDTPVQRVHDLVEIDLTVVDPRSIGMDPDLDRRPANEEVQALIREFTRAFDLSRAPLLRMVMVELSPHRHLLIYDIHHIIMDGFSLPLLTMDFIAFYQGARPQPLTVQYKDFAMWLYGEEGAQVIKKQENYWLERLSGGLPVLNLRTDFPRPQLQSFEGEQLSLTLPMTMLERLKQFIRKTESTLYMVLLAVSSLLLSKYTGQEDILVGSPVAARDRRELESIVGAFINVLIMRTFPRGDLTFSEFLGQVRTTTLESFGNQAYPFGKLMEKLGEPRDLSRNPIYDFELIVQNIDEPVVEIGDLRFITFAPEKKGSQVDITLEARETGSGLVLEFSYCCRLFKRQTIERFSAHFDEVLAAILENPGSPLAEIHISHEFAAAQDEILKQDEDGDFGF